MNKGEKMMTNCGPVLKFDLIGVNRKFWENIRERLLIFPMSCWILIIGDWNIKVGRDTWSNGQVWPRSTKWSRTKAKSFAKRTHWSQQTPSSNSARDDSTHGLYTWQYTDGQYQNQIDYILHSWRWRSSIQSAKMKLYLLVIWSQELTVVHIMDSLLPNSDLNWRK